MGYEYEADEELLEGEDDYFDDYDYEE